MTVFRCRPGFRAPPQPIHKAIRRVVRGGRAPTSSRLPSGARMRSGAQGAGRSALLALASALWGPCPCPQSSAQMKLSLPCAEAFPRSPFPGRGVRSPRQEGPATRRMGKGREVAGAGRGNAVKQYARLNISRRARKITCRPASNAHKCARYS